MARVSLKDIAIQVGVSSATVSLVLNEKDKKGRISKEVAEKVRTVAKELGYRTNMSAKSLRTGKTKTLGLIVADISNPFFSKLARHVENIAALKGYQVMFGSSDESHIKFQKLVDLFIEKNVDGILIAPPQNSASSIMSLVNRRIPTILVDRHIEGLPVSSVQLDNVGAAYNLTKTLINKGCKRIGFVAYNVNLPNIEKRYEGYVKALEENNIPFNKELIQSVPFEDFDFNIEKSIEHLIKHNVDALFFATNRVGVQSLITLQSSKLYNKLKYASIDYADEYKVAQVAITYIDQPIEGIGKRALDILFRNIEDSTYDEIESVLLQSKVSTLNQG